ncbi:MAG: TMAO reductase system periplasmic protein TorT [Deltaproteobacteria bacterium]|nr:TMAO reductase system periplasmic protein TorT [Deltaproteobacteria bacterium]
MQKNTKSIDGPSKRKRLHDVIYAQIYNRLKNRDPALWALTFFIIIVPSGVLAEKAWYPLEVDVWNPPFNEEHQRDQKVYTPLNTAQQKWRVRVFIPHLKDAYWLGVNYGLIDEARRLGIRLAIYEAGGYEQLAVQRRQIEDSLKEKPNGLIIGAISLQGLNDLVKKAADMGIPVLDLINGLASPDIEARAAVSFWDMGYQAGTYLGRLQKNMGKPMKVAWFPGPKGAGWVAAGDAGFRQAIANEAIDIVASQHGDTGASAQTKLVEAVLNQYAADLDCIVGTAVTAEVAVKILRRRRLADRIKILSYYYSPGVDRGIRRGGITAAPSDLTVLQARIAVDVMVRILEKKTYYKHVAPKVTVVDRENIRTWDSSTTLAPRGFRPIFSINE